MHDANEMECLTFENAIKNILLGKVTKSGVSDANNKLIITIFQMWGHIDPIRSGIGLNYRTLGHRNECIYTRLIINGDTLNKSPRGFQIT